MNTLKDYIINNHKFGANRVYFQLKEKGFKVRKSTVYCTFDELGYSRRGDIYISKLATSIESIGNKEEKDRYEIERLKEEVNRLKEQIEEINVELDKKSEELVQLCDEIKKQKEIIKYLKKSGEENVKEIDKLNVMVESQEERIDGHDERMKVMDDIAKEYQEWMKKIYSSPCKPR